MIDSVMYDLDLKALRQAWAVYFPAEPAQDEKYLIGWLRRRTVAEILDLFADAAEKHNVRPFRNVGAWISSRINPRPVEGVMHFDVDDQI